MEVEITITHSGELSKIHGAKYERLVEKFLKGLLNLPGVECVTGPVLVETEKERVDRERIEIERKARNLDTVKKTLISVLAEPEYLEKLYLEKSGVPT